MKEEIILNGQYVRYICYKPEKASRGQIVFLHGWRSQKEVWTFAMSRLRDNFEVYALDLPGFGGSSEPKETFDLSSYAGVVENFIEKLELKKVILVGHSFGGRICIKLASKKPQWLLKIILVDAAGFITKTLTKQILGHAALLFKPFAGFFWYQNLRRVFYKLLGVEDYLATPNLQKTFVNIVNEDLSEAMTKISFPTLIVWGQKDKDTPLEFGSRMATLIPNSKFVILPQAGHYSFVDQPEEFIKIFNEFI